MLRPNSKVRNTYRTSDANSVKVGFSYVVMGIKIKITVKLRDSRLLRFELIKREFCHPKCARKVSGLSRNGPLVTI